MAQQQRPMGITILAVLAFIGGILGICGGLSGIVAGSFLGGLAASVGASNAAALGGMAAVYSIVALAFAVADLVFGFGAWTLKPWAWMLGMVLFGLNIVFQLVALVAGWTTFGGMIIPVAIGGVIIYYLLTPQVKQAFGRA
jgi:uncharacterized membrane protein (DUF2068 family)